MRAIIPVAGLGSRLKPHTHTIPKVLLYVGDKPLLGHILTKLIKAGITKTTFITGHLGKMVREYVRENFPELEAEFIKQESLEGLGHAIYTAIPTIKEEELFIVLGDTIFEVDLDKVFQSKTSSLGVKQVDDPKRFGVAIVENGFITKLIEKPKFPPSNLALVGMYYFNDSSKLISALNEIVSKDIRTKGEIQLTDALQLMIERGEKFTTFQVDGWYDCGLPETLLATNRFLLDVNGNTSDLPNVVINPPVFISKNATVKNSVVGPYASISSGSHITDSVIRNSIIGQNAEVKGCLLENSIIGNNSAITGNFKRINAGDSSEIDFS